jgi:hypothetical protein
VLIFVGGKMTFLGRFFEEGHVPIELSLGVILGVIALSIGASLLFPAKVHHALDEPPFPLPPGHGMTTQHRHHESSKSEKKS